MGYLRRTMMALRTNHYDAAFEGFLRDARTPYVVVDEKRRAMLQQSSLKSMDFIVYSQRDRNLLVDVKGRRFPSGGAHGHRWENWATEDDIDSLLAWQNVFGGDFRAVLVFAYHVVEQRRDGQIEPMFEFRERAYAFYGVGVDEYCREMRSRSTSWETVWLPTREFRRMRVPIAEFL
jgi:hypothetical protein